jgi:hypothetical protein
MEIKQELNLLDIPDKVLETTKVFLKDKNRRYYGIAAASLHNQLTDPQYKDFKINPKLVNAGISGEKKTSLILRKWIKDKPDCVLIDSISLPLERMEPEVDGEEGQLDLGDTDHLLIIGSTLVIIDSKNWKSKATYKVSEDMEILRGKNSFPGSRPRINQAKYLWKKYYEEANIDKIVAFVCISSDTPTIIRDTNWWRTGYKLVNQETLIYFLDKLYNEEITNKDFIRVELVAKALQGLVKPFNQYRELLGNNLYDRLNVKR